jgi:hypothetical protein
VKLGKNSSDTGTLLSKAYGGEVMKNQVFFEWHERFKERSHVKISEDNAHHFLQYQGYCSL